MRSLFVKIFLWFWLAIILVAGAAVIGVALLRPGEPDTARWRSVAADILKSQAHAAVEMLEREGEGPLFEFFDWQDHAAGTHSFLLDAEDRDMAGHIPPTDLAELADAARGSTSMQVASSNGKSLIAIKSAGRKGEIYVLAREMLPESERSKGWPRRHR